MRDAPSNPQAQPAVGEMISALIVGASTFLLWMTLKDNETGDTVEAKGLDLDAGAAMILLAVIALVIAIIQFVKGASGRGRGLAITNIVLTALMALFALWVIAAPADVFAAQAAEEVANRFGISEGFAEEAIKQGVDEGAVDVSAEIGPIIALIGALIGLAASILGTRRAKRRDALATGTTSTAGTGPGAQPGPDTGERAGPVDATGSTNLPGGTPPHGPTQPGP